MENSLCKCDTGKQFSACCEPVLNGQKVPQNAVDVMRARYTAFVLGKIDFIMSTIAPSKKSEYDRKSVEDWSRSTEWTGLEIVSTENGGAADDTGEVEFIAHYRGKNSAKKHHEQASFVKIKGAWYFENGRAPAIDQVIRDAPKIGRNDPCTCGSGKKYKKCCGKM